jgi:hypothetical protein
MSRSFLFTTDKPDLFPPCHLALGLLNHCRPTPQVCLASKPAFQCCALCVRPFEMHPVSGRGSGPFPFVDPLVTVLKIARPCSPLSAFPLYFRLAALHSTFSPFALDFCLSIAFYSSSCSPFAVKLPPYSEHFPFGRCWARPRRTGLVASRIDLAFSRFHSLIPLLAHIRFSR